MPGGPTKFGWCLDGYHESCRAVNLRPSGEAYLCPCECHGEGEASARGLE